ncbi:MAG: PASTA domain-containing protein [Oscillospiraceae bacterium]|nr:PASTA domain-containing protein [Oscillospiraceae bacterium]
MKPLDILDALSDLPEDYAAFAVQKTEPQDAAGLTQDAQSAQEGIVMTQHGIKKKEPLHFGRAGIAAAVALCIGLNAALIYGIIRMKTTVSTDPGSAYSAGTEQNTSEPYMEVKVAVPTGVQLEMHNPTDEEIGVSGRFVVFQYGARVADCEVGAPDAVRVAANNRSTYIVNFPQLPAGSYTLYNLTEEGRAPGVFGTVDFEISAEYDSMVWIPGTGLKGMPYEEAKAMLEEKGVTVSKARSFFAHVSESAFVFTDQEIQADAPRFEVGDVVTMTVQPFKTEDLIYTTMPYYRYDGKGYWVKPDEKVTLEVYIGEDGDPSTVPDAEGMEFEASQEVIWAEGFAIDKHYAYDADVPEGRIISMEPKPGTERPIGETVRVMVSLGAKQDTVKIPDLTNLQQKFAKREIEERELKFELCHIDDPYTRAGDAVKTDPPAGTAVAIGETVRVYISTGNPNDTVYVPDFRGVDWKEAKKVTDELGLLLSVELVETDSEPAGTVLEQDKAFEEEVPVGSVVVCKVASDAAVPVQKITFRDTTGFAAPDDQKAACYCIAVRNKDYEILGSSSLFRFGKDPIPENVIVDCEEPNAKVFAVLIDAETKQEAEIGSYLLHSDTCTFDTISENIEAAFRQLGAFM